MDRRTVIVLFYFLGHCLVDGYHSRCYWSFFLFGEVRLAIPGSFGVEGCELADWSERFNEWRDSRPHVWPQMSADFVMASLLLDLIHRPQYNIDIQLLWHSGRPTAYRLSNRVLSLQCGSTAPPACIWPAQDSISSALLLFAQLCLPTPAQQLQEKRLVEESSVRNRSVWNFPRGGLPVIAQNFAASLYCVP